MQKISELLNITVTKGNLLRIYHPVFKDKLIYYEDVNGYWYKYEYDSNGNIIYCENSKGNWTKREYDLNDKEIYYEDSYGYWEKREYDSNRKEIYFENSNGSWYKKEFDSNSNLIYRENNHGIIIDNRTTELTLDQIAEKFNIPVNQLKIKK